MSPYSHRSQGGRFTPADQPTAKRIEVWLDPPTLAIVDAHANAIGQGRGKAIADLLKPTASGAAEPAVVPAAPRNKGTKGQLVGPGVIGKPLGGPPIDPTPTLAEQGVSKPVKAPPKAVREWIASSAIDTAEVRRMEALDQDTDPNNATTARHEATAMELFAQKLRHPRQRWEFHGAEGGWLECRVADALGEAESLKKESLPQAIAGYGIFTPAEVKQQISEALAEAAGYRAVAAWLGIELQNLCPSQTESSD